MAQIACQTAVPDEDDPTSLHQLLPPALPSSVDSSSSDLIKPSNTVAADSFSPDPDTDNHFIVMRSMKAPAAFVYIGRMLDLRCMQSTGFNIGVPTSAIPPSIAPTLQQLVIPHKPYIDMLPWPSMRDRMLSSSQVINETEFIQDMASNHFRVWGSCPWDPMGWEVGPYVASKWWFLMDEEVMRTTNFWRSQRGEEALPVMTFITSMGHSSHDSDP